MQVEMCGRFVAAFTAERFEMAFGVRPPPDLAAPRYNVTPGRPVAALRAGAGGGVVEAVALYWGMLPPWVRDRGDARGAQINARSETAATKPMFRDAFRRRRCLIPADGFYEWQRAADGSGAKQPWFVGLTGGRPFAFAGVWQRTREPGGGTFDSCAILTTDANELVKPIHHRMPVILRPEHHAAWFDPELQDPSRITELLAPIPQAEMVAHPVGLRVNDPRYDDPGLREPRDAAPPERRQGSLF